MSNLHIRRRMASAVRVFADSSSGKHQVMQNPLRISQLVHRKHDLANIIGRLSACIISTVEWATYAPVEYVT